MNRYKITYSQDPISALDDEGLPSLYLLEHERWDWCDTAAMRLGTTGVPDDRLYADSLVSKYQNALRRLRDVNLAERWTRVFYPDHKFLHIRVDYAGSDLSRSILAVATPKWIKSIGVEGYTVGAEPLGTDFALDLLRCARIGRAAVEGNVVDVTFQHHVMFHPADHRFPSRDIALWIDNPGDPDSDESEEFDFRDPITFVILHEGVEVEQVILAEHGPNALDDAEVVWA